MKSADERHQALSPPNAGRRRRAMRLAFLPAALEIVETPPSPIGRAIAATHHRALLPRAGLGLLRQGRHRRHGAGQDRPERPHQGDPAVRDRRRARHPRARRADGQGRRWLIELDPTINDAERDHFKATSSPPGSTSPGCGRRWPTATIPSPTSIRRRARAPIWSRPSSNSCSTRRPSSAPSSPRSTDQMRRRRPSATRSPRPSPSSRRSSRCPATGRHSQDDI